MLMMAGVLVQLHNAVVEEDQEEFTRTMIGFFIVLPLIMRVMEWI